MSEIAKLLEIKDEVTLGKFLKEVENETPTGYEILKHCSLLKGKAHIVGITGPPGAGKSTLVGKLCKALAKKGLSIGVVCVDPTSPFTKGALLGDRIRMQELAKIPNIFIKSLATRGSLGGLATSTDDVVQVMDAFDKDIVLIETVGVGQAEFDVLHISDTVILVNVPGLGDTLQTLKAGIMEIADIYVINQADRPGAEQSVKDLQLMVHEADKEGWEPPVYKTVATMQEGIDDLIEGIDNHKDFLKQSGLWDVKRRNRNSTRLKNMVHTLLSLQIDNFISSNNLLVGKIEAVRNGKEDPVTVAKEIIESYFTKI